MVTRYRDGPACIVWVTQDGKSTHAGPCRHPAATWGIVRANLTVANYPMKYRPHLVVRLKELKSERITSNARAG